MGYIGLHCNRSTKELQFYFIFFLRDLETDLWKKKSQFFELCEFVRKRMLCNVVFPKILAAIFAPHFYPIASKLKAIRFPILRNFHRNDPLDFLNIIRTSKGKHCLPFRGFSRWIRHLLYFLWTNRLLAECFMRPCTVLWEPSEVLANAKFETSITFMW